MSRPGPSSAISPHALQTAPLQTPQAARMAAADELGQAGSKDALTRLNAAMAEVRALAAAPLLNRAMEALRAEDAAGGTEFALKALERDERSGFGWYLLAIAREKAGDFASSVGAYEMALKLLPDHAEVANDLGRLAYKMGMREQAEKLFRHFLARHPDHPEGANNLACAVREQLRLEEAIDILKPAILRAPENAMLWNTMGTVVGEQGDWATAQVFFQEALSLQPEFPKACYNLGNCLLMLDQALAALEASDAALAGVLAEDERQMMRLSRATILISAGRLGDGWDEYEARFHPQFSEITYFLVERPRWTPGAELAGKTLLVVGEQGLGDEILFANTLPDVIEALGPKGRLILAVEPRLVAMFQRAFPMVQVVGHATYALGTRPARGIPDLPNLDAVDLWTPIASLLRQFRRSVTDFPARTGYLAPDPARVAFWREQLDALPGRKVGLLWKSGIKKDARHRYFAAFDDWRAVLQQPGIGFVNLQYGDCAAELAHARDAFGVEIWQPPGIDLKQDLDEVAALSCALDLVIGFSNATFNIAAACGAPSWLITIPGSWPRLGAPDSYPWYPQARVFAVEQQGDWTPVMQRAAAALGDFTAER
jgi:tetratricopeptide (TPR) repeat protein